MVVGGVRKVCLAPLTTRPPRVTTTVTALATDYAHPTASSCIGSLLEPMDPQLAHNDAAMRLHPFVSTAQRRGGDNSVDNTADNLYHGVSQDTHTERLFGECWMGVACRATDPGMLTKMRFRDTDQGGLVMLLTSSLRRAVKMFLRGRAGQTPHPPPRHPPHPTPPRPPAPQISACASSI